MNKKFHKLIWTIAILIIFLILAVFITHSGIFKNSIKSDIIYLTSTKLSGRLTGTEEALKAESYIKNSLEKIGLDKYKSSYLVPYNHVFYNPEKQTHSIKLILGDKKVEFNYGTDFIESIGGNIDKQLNLTFDTANISEDKILVITDRKQLESLNIQGMIVFIKKNNFIKAIAAEENQGETHIIQISENMYKALESNKTGRVKIKFNYTDELIQANNIVAKIKGKDSSNAMVLSAHFDHVGSAGKDVFHGAIDNASGTSLLLDLAKKLKKYYKDKLPERDIIICFFNGEDSHLQGSKAFVKTLKEDYSELCDINFDCIGIKNGGALALEMKNGISSKLLEDINSYFTEKKYKTTILDADLASDHFTFLQNDIAAINIAQMNVGKIHTVEDTINEIDISYLSKISSELLDFITKNINNSYEINKESSNEENSTISKKDQDAIDEMWKKLKEHEYMRTEMGLFNNLRIAFTDNLPGKVSIAELNKYYPTLHVPKEISGFKLDDIDVTENQNVDFFTLELNKLYFKGYNIKDVQLLEVTYKKNENVNYIIKIIKELNHVDQDSEDLSENPLISDYEIKDEKKDMNGDSYNVCADNNGLQPVYRKVKDDAMTFHIFLSSVNLDDIKDIDSKTITNNLINCLK
jgi:aminopeptidase YwaD